MTTQTIALNSHATLGEAATGWRATVALAAGWAAYGLFYVTVFATVIGVPVAVALYLLGVWPG